MQVIFEVINKAYMKYYSPSKHQAMNKIIVFFKRRVVLKQNIPGKRNTFWHQLFQMMWFDWLHLWHEGIFWNGLTLHNTRCNSYLCCSDDFVRRVEGQGHKLHVDSFFSSSVSSEDLTKKNIKCCEAAGLNRKAIWNSGWKNLRLKWGDIWVSTKGGLTALSWKDERDVHMLTNMHNPPAEGNFCDGNWKAQKPAVVENYSRPLGCVGKGDRIANTLLAAAHGSGQAVHVPPLGHDSSEQLHSFLLLW
jgi:hypothetical protein